MKPKWLHMAFSISKILRNLIIPQKYFPIDSKHSFFFILIFMKNIIGFVIKDPMTQNFMAT